MKTKSLSLFICGFSRVPYRTSVFFLAESGVESVLKEYLRIRRHLRIISHRNACLSYLLSCSSPPVNSLPSSTPLALAPTSICSPSVNLLCAPSLLSQDCWCCFGVQRRSRKAQAITCLAAKWHMCATIDSLESNEPESPRIQISYPRVPFLYSHAHCQNGFP